MNVTCTGCPAKYSVPDDKVRGKKVRITCKHCGTNIVVDGSALGASQSVLPQLESEGSAPAAGSAGAAPAAVAAAAPAVKAAEPEPPAAPVTETTWLVGFVDEHQEQHTTSAVVDLYAAGKIDDEALVWKDGMADWLSPFDVPEIAAALKQRGVARRAPSFALSSDDEPTVVGRSPFEDQTVVSSAPSEAAKSAPAKSPVAPAVVASPRPAPEIKPAAVARQSTPEIKPAAAARQSTPEIKPAAAPKAVAARRTEKRAEVDLFGGVANAGSETDAALDFGAPEEPAHKMTGARNESSVLFSLDALTKPDTKTGQKKAQEKEQEKRATAELFGDSAPDSLMNVGGGSFAALTAPDFTKPVAAAPEPVRPSDPVEVPNDRPSKKKGGAGVMIAAIVGIAAAAGLAFVFMSKKPASDKPADSSTADTKSGAPSTPVATATETAAPSAAPEAASAPAAGTSTPTPPNAASTGSPAASKPTTPAPTTAAPGTPGTVNKPAEKPAEATKPEPAPAPAAGADFDKSAAIAALSAAAASAASCKKPDGPTGGGKASVTFAPSGRATNSTVTGAFAGTEVGGCVARIFRSAKIPPFAGDPVTVSKSFSIE
ncbi:MAG TPA: zinc-ribbon domain-containing protein [Polyangiaceae bacterium]|jgi:predicted Zn finger-like uncharacterized protein|nr:zinc-ribbon domain-containing protein [Polyangiaceae bacterium]